MNKNENGELLEKLRGMNDEALKDAIAEVARALGADEAQTKRAVTNMRTIRRKLNSAGSRDVDRLLGELGEEQAEEIMRRLRL